MAYAVLQKSLESPSLEQLKLAFRATPGLTALDAGTLGRDAFGLLGKGFDLPMAEALQHSLAAQGVAAEVLDEANLPKLPETFFLAQLEATPNALLLHDSLGRVAELEWRNILIIAAGVVPVSEFKEIRTETKQWPGANAAHHRRGIGHHIRTWMADEGLLDPQHIDPFGFSTSVHTETKEEMHERLLLEIILAGGSIRYSLNSGKAPFLFAGLGERRTNNVLRNFSLLIHDLTHGAPQAAINRGAWYLSQNDLSFGYNGKTAFYNEIIWLLWQKSLDQPSGQPQC